MTCGNAVAAGFAAGGTCTLAGLAGGGRTGALPAGSQRGNWYFPRGTTGIAGPRARPPG
ncbi:hypothetical protein [Senegalimassilia faecalis]|uniref:hypothetical protein n=1 Tax=Senegalimassilia faecalis TaxID=2509433 RepID=UPI003A97B315